MEKIKTLVEALRPVLSMAVEHTPEHLVEEYLESIVRDNPEIFCKPLSLDTLGKQYARKLAFSPGSSPLVGITRIKVPGGGGK